MACNWLSEGEDDTGPHDVTRQPAVVVRHPTSDDDPVLNFSHKFVPLPLSHLSCGMFHRSAFSDTR